MNIREAVLYELFVRGYISVQQYMEFISDFNKFDNFFYE